MRRCEDEKMRYRPPLLEEPCAQTLSGKVVIIQLVPLNFMVDNQELGCPQFWTKQITFGVEYLIYIYIFQYLLHGWFYLLFVGSNDFPFLGHWTSHVCYGQNIVSWGTPIFRNTRMGMYTHVCIYIYNDIHIQRDR